MLGDSEIRRAFTLIELLVVIATISILAVILFPVFGRARENARRSACQSNLKQIGLGVLQYIQDYQQVLPPCKSTDPARSSYRSLIQPYLKTPDVFACPSNPSKGELTEDSANHTPRSYNANGQTGANLGGTPPMRREADGGPSRITALGQPAQTILVGEAKSPKSWLDSNTGPEFVANASGHFAVPNWLFADGHVKAVKYRATGTPVNMWTIQEDGPAGPIFLNQLSLAQDALG